METKQNTEGIDLFLGSNPQGSSTVNESNINDNLESGNIDNINNINNNINNDGKDLFGAAGVGGTNNDGPSQVSGVVIVGDLSERTIAREVASNGHLSQGFKEFILYTLGLDRDSLIYMDELVERLSNGELNTIISKCGL